MWLIVSLIHLCQTQLSWAAMEKLVLFLYESIVNYGQITFVICWVVSWGDQNNCSDRPFLFLHQPFGSGNIVMVQEKHNARHHTESLKA
jgi:hypothetical protein